MEKTIVTYRQLKREIKKQEPKLYEFLEKMGVNNDKDIEEIENDLWAMGKQGEFYAFTLHSFLAKYKEKYSVPIPPKAV